MLLSLKYFLQQRTYHTAQQRSLLIHKACKNRKKREKGALQILKLNLRFAVTQNPLSSMNER